MCVYGHKFESSIRLSEVKQKGISHTLSTACFESLESHEQTEADFSLVGNTVPRSPMHHDAKYRIAQPKNG